MAPPKRRHRSSSVTSSASEKRNRRAERLHTYRTKHVASSSRRRERSQSSDFEDYRHRHKYSPPKSRYYRPRRKDSYCSKRRAVSSDSYDSDDYSFHRHRKPHQYKTRRSPNKRNPTRRSPCRKSPIRWSPCRKSPCRKTPCRKSPIRWSPCRRSPTRRKSYSRRKRISSSPDYSSSRDFQHHRQPVLMIEDRKREPNDSDIEILDEIKEGCRSSSEERLNHWYQKSGKYLQEANRIKDKDLQVEKLNKALKFIEKALMQHQDDDELLSKIYSRKGTIYFLLDKPKCSFQAFIDWEHGYLLDVNNMESRKNMSKFLFMGANKLYRKKAYCEALGPLRQALDLDKSNGEASILLRITQKKVVEVIKRKEITMNASIVSKTDPKKALDVKPTSDSKHNISVFSEIEQLNKLAKQALEDSNYPRAIIYLNKALGLRTKMPGDIIFHQLLELKQNIKNNVMTMQKQCPESVSENSENA